jgi:hypothetical protein
MSIETPFELLDQLIAQGLAPSHQDISKIRQLVAILIQACLLQPLADHQPLTDDTLRRARDTLRVLHQHSLSHPELLLHTSEGIPLYKFLLPRIIFASAQCQDSDLAEELVAAGDAMLRAMCTVPPEDGGAYSKGRHAASMAIKALRLFAEGTFPHWPS